MKYHEFVEDLLKQMTIDEKIVQVSCIMPIVVLTGQEVDVEKLKKECPNGVGRMTQFANTFTDGPKAVAKAYNAIQKYHIEKTRLGIPVLMQNESAVGLNEADATIFPTPIGLASTWEPDLVYEMGKIISKQAKAVGIRKCLSPVADVARDSRWGRVGETFGEDPTLVSAFSVAESKGIQGDYYGDNVISCAKHFMGYGASEAGINCAVINLGEKELKEVYGMPFAAMIKLNDLQSVMVTYSEIDGIPMTINNKYVNGYLRKELGFTGSAICDGQSIPWVHHTNGIGKSKEDIAIRAAKVGIDADTPMTEYYKLLKKEIEEGRLDEEVLNNLVRRVLNQKYELGLFDNPYVDVDKIDENYNSYQDQEVSRLLSEKSMTLLKNKGAILPLKDKYRKIGLVGPFADVVSTIFGGYAYPAHVQSLFSAVYNYSNSMNGGFGGFYEKFMDLDAMAKYFEIDSHLSYDENLENFLRKRFGFISIYEAMKKCFTLSEIDICKGYFDSENYDKDIENTLEKVKDDDVLVLCLGEITGFGKNATSGEGKNTQILSLPDKQCDLVFDLAKLGKPMILVLLNGRGLEITNIEPYFDAILETWYAGNHGPMSIAKTLHGDINPGGKLSITFPRYSSQCPIYYGFHTGSGYHSISKAMGLGDDFNKNNEPLYCFGHGLSYTNFEYTNLLLKNKKVKADEDIVISFDVENTGSIAGEEVAQVYFRNVTPSINRPFRELRAFKRVNIEAGKTINIIVTIPVNSLAYYNEKNNFIVEPSHYEVYIGSSSEDIRLVSEFDIVGEVVDVSNKRKFLFDACVNKK